MQNRSTPPIIQAAKNGDIEEVKRLLREHPEDVNQMNVLGLTALHFAVAEGHIATVDLLLNHGAAVNPGNDGESSKYMTPLMKTVSGNHVALVQMLLDRGALVNRKYRIKEQTALHLAVRYCPFNEEIVLALLRHGANVDERDENGQTPLMVAAASGFEKAIDILLKHRANPFLEDNNHNTLFTLLDIDSSFRFTTEDPAKMARELEMELFRKEFTNSLSLENKTESATKKTKSSFSTAPCSFTYSTPAPAQTANSSESKPANPDHSRKRKH